MLTVNPNEPYMIVQESYILTNYTSPKFFFVCAWMDSDTKIGQPRRSPGFHYFKG